MRRVTRNLILALLGVVVVLLALGALAGLLKSGDPYYLTATAVNASDGNANATDGDAVSVRDNATFYRLAVRQGT